jgi:hypothetical protein
MLFTGNGFKSHISHHYSGSVFTWLIYSTPPLTQTYLFPPTTLVSFFA